MDIVQRNLRKCFEGIQCIELNGTSIIAMISPETERMPFSRSGL